MDKGISHIDTDGNGVNVIARTIGMDIDMINLNYDKLDDYVQNFIRHQKYLEYEKIYIVDLSVSYETANMIECLEEKDRFVLLDHHYEHAKWLNVYSWANIRKYNKNRRLTCGSEMFYEELLNRYVDVPEIYNLLLNEKLVEFVESVRLYDTWDCSMVSRDTIKRYKPRELDMLFKLDLKKGIIVNMIVNELKNRRFFISPKNLKKITKEKECYDNLVDEYWEERKEVLFEGYHCLLVEVDKDFKFISELGNEFTIRAQGIDFVIVYNPYMKNVSLRSIKEHINLGTIARKFNGGGHEKAAGFKIEDIYSLCKVL